MKNVFVALIVAISVPLGAQILSVTPAFPTQNDTVTVVYDATQGNAALTGVSPVYAHAGLITSASTSPTNWQFVQGTWGQPTAKVLMTNLGNNKHQIKYHIPTFYGFPGGTQVQQLAFVFRNAAGTVVGRSADGTDIYYPIYPANSGLLAAFFAPSGPQIANPGDTLKLVAAANQSAVLKIYDNGVLKTTVSNTASLNYNLIATTPGAHTVVLEAVSGTSTAYDTIHYTGNPIQMVAPVPQGWLDGANYLNDSTVGLVLRAPFKEFVYVLGDFNNFLPSTSYFMNKSTDGERFWLTIPVAAGQQYAYQYWIDGAIKVADPLAELILDPNSDGGIPAGTWPGLHPYPTGKTTGFCALLRPGAPEYAWKNSSFTPPGKADLIIYELLVRDFIAARNYQALIDTLGYLQRLGINAIELMPNNEFENNESWGYNPSFHMALDKYYGTPEKFKEFVDSCHSKGIAVIADMVLNHAFGQNPMVNMYWDQVNSRPASNSPWFNAVCPHPPYCWGYDFNHEKQATKDYVDRVTTFWLQEYRIDGIRFDYTKGFMNGSAGASAVRQAIIKRIGDTIWSINPNAHLILEHWADNSEEKALADYGFMLWGNSTYNFHQAGQGNAQSNFSWAYHGARGWTKPGLVSYPESHDEERLMYEVLTYGSTANPNHNPRQLATGLRRAEAVNLFAYLIPGPRMIWMFGELGYDVSINNPCRVCNKPIRWNYYQVPERRRLYDVTSAIFNLRRAHPATFRDGQFTYSFSGNTKRMVFNSSGMDAVVLGNFAVTTQSIIPAFPSAGTWYDYFSGDSITVLDVNASISLAPGAYRVYTSVKLAQPQIALDVAELPTASASRVYPNPAANGFWFESAGPGGRLTLVDAQGRVVRTWDRSGLSQEFYDLGSVPAGWYVVVLERDGVLERHALQIQP
jgi:glycosidase